MANLNETAVWESGIYQIETTDPVIGGTDGISNNQAKQLANRTSYLKARVEEAASNANNRLLTSTYNTDKATFATKTELNTKLNATATAVSATKLATPRTINGVAFDGTANITIQDSTKLSISSFTGSLNQSGYVKLPNRLIMQWGIINKAPNQQNHTLTFNLAFPSLCVGLFLEINGSTNSASATPTVVSKTLTEATVFLQSWNTANISGYKWLAIGY